MAWVGTCKKCGGAAVFIEKMGWHCKKCGYLKPEDVKK